MKIAVPFEDGQVFQHFGRSAQFKVYEAENGQLLRTEVIPTNGQGHGAADAAVADYLAGKLVFDPDIHCTHHDHDEGHSCGSHCGGRCH